MNNVYWKSQKTKKSQDVNISSEKFRRRFGVPKNKITAKKLKVDKEF